MDRGGNDQRSGDLLEADRKKGVLQVHAIHQDVSFTRAMTTDVQDEVEALASWLGLTVVRG